MHHGLKLENCVLGETAGSVRLRDRAAIRDACTRMAAQASRQLQIFSHDLDAPLYDNADFIASIRQFVVRSPHALVRILLLDTELAIRNGHRLVELARLLTSGIQTRRVPKELDHHVEAYLTADDKGYVLRPLAHVFEGSTDFFAPRQARNIRSKFEQTWERSTQCLNLISFGRGL